MRCEKQTNSKIALIIEIQTNWSLFSPSNKTRSTKSPAIRLRPDLLLKTGRYTGHLRCCNTRPTSHEQKLLYFFKSPHRPSHHRMLYTINLVLALLTGGRPHPLQGTHTMPSRRTCNRGRTETHSHPMATSLHLPCRGLWAKLTQTFHRTTCCMDLLTCSSSMFIRYVFACASLFPAIY
jgi:hypothetical protein